MAGCPECADLERVGLAGLRQVIQLEGKRAHVIVDGLVVPSAGGGVELGVDYIWVLPQDCSQPLEAGQPLPRSAVIREPKRLGKRFGLVDGEGGLVTANMLHAMDLGGLDVGEHLGTTTWQVVMGPLGACPRQSPGNCVVQLGGGSVANQGRAYVRGR